MRSVSGARSSSRDQRLDRSGFLYIGASEGPEDGGAECAAKQGMIVGDDEAELWGRVAYPWRSL